VFNYWICVITGSIFLGSFPINTQAIISPWFKWAILMGALFISVFNLIAISSIKVGVTITQTANKLSLVIPVLFAFFIYQESLSWLKIIGILCAIAAVILTIEKKNKLNTTTKRKINLEYMLPIILFISSGIIDTLTKFVEKTYLSSTDTSNAYLISGFFVAATLGTLVLTCQLLSGKRNFNYKNLLAGIILGVPNYFSIYFLIKALQIKTLNSSATIPMNNIGVLFLASLFGIFIFKEKLSKANYIGLLLSLIAIVLIYLGDKM
jgi:drug/metabolite transporter (DMT)-like permease